MAAWDRDQEIGSWDGTEVCGPDGGGDGGLAGVKGVEAQGNEEEELEDPENGFPAPAVYANSSSTTKTSESSGVPPDAMALSGDDIPKNTAHKNGDGAMWSK